MQARITTTSPFFNALVREAIGYDPLAQFENLANQAKYPPHNIAKIGDDKYKLTMAVAGFSKNDLTITVEEGTLTVVGQQTHTEAPEGFEMLYHGIASRDFERSWKLGEYVEVAEVALKDGMLTIDLERRVPEAQKARKIDIK
jgi:molecular chaperone IbpA